MAPSPAALPADDTDDTSLRPFAPGDLFVAATWPDERAGCLLQLDAGLKPRALLRLPGVASLAFGPAFGPEGTLWVQDSAGWNTLRVDRDGHLLEPVRYEQRPFSRLHVLPDGNHLLTEALAGEEAPTGIPGDYRPLPGHKRRLGSGELHVYTPDGELMAVYEPELAGDESGSVGVTHSVLAPDGATLIYISAGGPRLMRFDLERGRQLPDLRPGGDGDPAMTHFDLDLTPGGEIVACMGNRLDVLTADGVWLRTFRLPGFGWSCVEARRAGFACVGNAGTGELIQVDLATGQVVGGVELEPARPAGLARFVPGGPARG